MNTKQIEMTLIEHSKALGNNGERNYSEEDLHIFQRLLSLEKVELEELIVCAERLEVPGVGIEDLCRVLACYYGEDDVPAVITSPKEAASAIAQHLGVTV